MYDPYRDLIDKMKKFDREVRINVVTDLTTWKHFTNMRPSPFWEDDENKESLKDDKQYELTCSWWVYKNSPSFTKLII